MKLVTCGTRWLTSPARYRSRMRWAMTTVVPGILSARCARLSLRLLTPLSTCVSRTSSSVAVSLTRARELPCSYARPRRHLTNPIVMSRRCRQPLPRNRSRCRDRRRRPRLVLHPSAREAQACRDRPPPHRGDGRRHCHRDGLPPCA